MKKNHAFKLVSGFALGLALGSAPALADPDADNLIVNDEIEMVTEAAAPAHLENVDTIYSGWRFRSDETQVLQMDDFENPGFVGVETAMEAWETVEGTEGKSCASCHGDVEESMMGVRAVYPKWNEDAGKVHTLEMEIDNCRTEHMGAEPWGWSGKNTNMVALISSVSRGMPVNVAIDGPAQSTWEMGKELYYTRTGQLELSCANCHEDSYGMMIRADHLSQGQINGFPVYRLKNTKLNSPHDRFVGCVRDTRAETFKRGSPEFVALELYVASRGNGLSVEGPSVRN
uniref:SoxAX cytochrome complex subunit A n=1 Tax=uncultured bacterium ws101A12 TaxID=1131826 RepID=I1X4F2_9BACT|nr:sulfur/thiosulfate oxidation protein SoxA [uncultured bacterium ws101A12]